MDAALCWDQPKKVPFMSAERMPQNDASRPDDSLLVAPLQAMTRAVLRAPRTVLALAGGLAFIAILLAVRDMGFRTSRLDLLNPESDYNQLWLEYLEEFGEGDDAVVVVRGANRETVTETIDVLAEAITQDDRHFQNVLHKIDVSAVRFEGIVLPSRGRFDADGALAGRDPAAAGRRLVAGAARSSTPHGHCASDPVGRANGGRAPGATRQDLVRVAGYRRRALHISVDNCRIAAGRNARPVPRDGCQWRADADGRRPNGLHPVAARSRRRTEVRSSQPGDCPAARPDRRRSGSSEPMWKSVLPVCR